MPFQQALHLSSIKSRSTVRVGQHLEKNLLAYATAASAGML